jgi:hypothetical protein
VPPSREMLIVSPSRLRAACAIAVFCIEVVDLTIAEGRLFEAVGPPRHGAPVDALKGSGLLEGGEIASDGLRGDVEIGGQIRDIDPARVADQLSDASLPFFSEHVRPFLLSAGGELRLTVPSDNRRGYLLVSLIL